MVLSRPKWLQMTGSIVESPKNHWTIFNETNPDQFIGDISEGLRCFSFANQRQLVLFCQSASPFRTRVLWGKLNTLFSYTVYLIFYPICLLPSLLVRFIRQNVNSCLDFLTRRSQYSLLDLFCSAPLRVYRLDHEKYQIVCQVFVTVDHVGSRISFKGIDYTSWFKFSNALLQCCYYCFFEI